MFAPAQAGVDFISAAATMLSHPGPLLVGAIVVFVAARQWRKMRRERARNKAALNWPTITATIEIPTVVSPLTPEAKGQNVATLTYFYRNPELQIGEYRRSFPSKERAKAWAAQFKGRAVPVHVNPDDPADSVLLEGELAGSDFAIHVPLKAGEAALEEMPQVLSPAIRLVCSLAELAGLAGMATSAVLLCANIALHGKLRPYGYFWIGGILVALCIVSATTVQIYLARSEEGRWLLKSYKRWCPGWMRWSLNLTGGSVAFKPALHLFNLIHLFVPHSSHWMSHHPWAQGLMPYVPYVIGCWLFFMVTAFHAALLRSQEELHFSVVEA
ncbi:MAG: hypothetical protein WBP85_14190 [Terracidiphilus sp.]